MNRITHFNSDGEWISRYDDIALSIRSFIYRVKEDIPMKIAQWLPNKVVLWCFIRAMGNASSCDKCGGSGKHVDEISYKEAYDCWEGHHKEHKMTESEAAAAMALEVGDLKTFYKILKENNVTVCKIHD